MYDTHSTLTGLQDYVLGEREDEVGTLVKAGLHEVDMAKRRMQPCYWPGTYHRVVRGSWYIDKGSGYAPLKVNIVSCVCNLYDRSKCRHANFRSLHKSRSVGRHYLQPAKLHND